MFGESVQQINNSNKKATKWICDIPNVYIRREICVTDIQQTLLQADTKWMI